MSTPEQAIILAFKEVIGNQDKHATAIHQVTHLLCTDRFLKEIVLGAWQEIVEESKKKQEANCGILSAVLGLAFAAGTGYGILCCKLDEGAEAEEEGNQTIQ